MPFLRLTVFLVSLLMPAATIAGAQPFLIGAWYFGLWTHKEPSRQLSNAERFYGRRDIWAGIRDCAERDCGLSGARPGDNDLSSFASRKPLLGYYDVMDDPAVVSLHMRQAASAGLSFFAVYWYIDGNGDIRYDPTFAMRKPGPVKYALALISLNGVPISPETWRTLVVPKIVQHLEGPNYLKMDGRPVLILFALKFTEPDYLPIAIGSLSNQNPYIVSVLDGRAKQATANAIRRVGVNAVTCHMFDIGGAPETYERYRSRWMSGLQLHLSMLPEAIEYIPCAAVGFDARPWFWIAGGPNATRRWTIPEERPYLIGNTLSQFALHLIDIRGVMALHSNKVKKMAIIYAWNEWGEGGSIEPSLRFGYDPLDAIRSTFGLTPTAKRYCPALAPGCPSE